MSEPVTADPMAIPHELRERDQWLMWDRSNDTPRQPHWRGNFAISWSDPDDWHSFDEAYEAMQDKDSWGIGYVMAADNDDYARGLYGVIDIDGCTKGKHGDPKEWVPALDLLADGGYVEWSPSGTGLHIPLVGVDKPDWWTDEHFTAEEHEGVELLTHKFCTFTGDQLNGSGEEVLPDGDHVEEWLREAYKSVTGEDPLDKEQRSLPARDGDHDDDWGEEEVAEMLDHIDADCSYSQWRDIGFALHDHFNGGATGKRLYEDWSRDGSKWDDEAAEYLDRIWDDATPGGGRTLGTIVHLAKQAGWTPPQRTTTDGGATAAASPAADPSGPGSDRSDKSTQQKVLDRVIGPLNPPEESDAEPISEDRAREELADILCEDYHFIRPRSDTRGWQDTLYVYSEEDGIYEPFGDEFLDREVERLMGSWANNNRVNEIRGKIERRSRVSVRRLEANPERLVVANGIVDLTTGELHEQTPEEYHKAMVDVAYDETAECPAIDEFLHDVVDGSDVDTLYRLIAHALYKDYPAEKAAMLLGDGRNGKSVFLSLVESFLGQWNVSNQSLQALNEDEWAANNLIGKLANVHPDMSDQTVETMQEFKKLTGNDTISANVKFEKPVRFENHATMLFACNRMPVLNDDSRGNWRRWLLIDFPNTFEPGADETEPKDVLMDRLTDEEELQGLLARCVEEISAWDDGREWFPNAPDWEETRRRIRRAAEPVYDFAAACLTEPDGDEGFETTDDVRRAYQAYATAEGLPSMSREAFGKKLLAQTDFAIEKKQKRVDGRRHQVYEGVAFTPRGLQLANAEDVGDDGDDETAQSSFGGPQGRAQRVVELCREHVSESEPIPHDYLVGVAVGQGMERDEAETAIQKARNQGDLAGEESYLPT